MAASATDVFTIRPATENDAATILSLITELAVYEKLEHQVEATEDMLKKWLFKECKAESVIAEENGGAIGFALFFTSFSTFLAKPGIYLEDLYIQPEARGKGYGKRMLQFLAREVIKRGYGRLEWACLDWNKPSIGFYLSLGASPMDEWTTYRLIDEPLKRLAGL